MLVERSLFLPIMASFVLFFLSLVAGQYCPNPTVVSGYGYCNPVSRVVFENVGHSGTYDLTTGMTSSPCGTTHQSHAFSGPLAPFDEDLSVHLRGPLSLKKFAVYTPASQTGILSKRAIPLKEQKCKTVTVTLTEVADVRVDIVPTQWTVGPETFSSDQTIISVLSVYTKGPTPENSLPAAPTSSGQSTNTTEIPNHPMASATSEPPTKNLIVETSSAGDWAQIAYYNSDSKVSQGVTFLNNNGGPVSGVWDTCFGPSLSYASSDSTAAAASPQLFDGTLADVTELSIFSDQSCDDAPCGFSRPGGVNYYGWAGASKLFLMEFTMPGALMPAIWFLNGQIPRIGQYIPGSCWATGCGELDVFEILSNGNTRLTATAHAAAGAGTSDYIVRPENEFIKAAILMYNNTFVIQVLSTDFSFSASLTASQIESIASNDGYDPDDMDVQTCV